MSKKSLFLSLMYLLLGLFIVPASAIAEAKVDVEVGTKAQPNIPSYNVGHPETALSNFPVLGVVDHSQSLTLQQIQNNPGLGALHDSQFHYAIDDANHWLIFTLTNTTDLPVERVIRFTEAHPEHVNLYYQLDNIWVTQQSGVGVAMDERPLAGRAAAFEVAIPAQNEITIYIFTNSTKRMFITNVEVLNKVQHNTDNQFQLVLYMLFFGACFSLIIYNVFLCSFLKDTLYLYYIGYGVSFFCFTLAFSGYDLYLHSNITLHHMLEASPVVAGTFFTLFITRVLDTPKRLPRLHKWLVANVGFNFALSLWALLYTEHLHIIVAISMPLTMFVTSVIWYAAFKRIPLAVYLVVGTSALSIGLFLIQANVYSLVEHNWFTRYAFMAGTLIELLVFSFALAHRLKDAQDENEHSQTLLLETKSRANQHLIEQVELRTQELQLATSKAEKANQAKGDFLATVNHEIRTPLSGILGMIELLQQEQLPATSMSYVNTLKVSGNHLSSLVNNVLEMSKIDLGHIELVQESFSLDQLLDQLKGIFDSTANQKQIKLTFNVALQNGDPQWVGDINRIRQILINIIGNSLKFTTHGHVTVSITKGLKSLDVDIEDTGPGISPDFLPFIFSAYEQELKQHNNGQVGTGLGLNISQKLVHAMDGELRVSSLLNEGTTFHLHLPIGLLAETGGSEVHQSSLSEDAHPISLTSLDLSGTSILLIEDSDVNQMLIEAYLAPTGIAVTTCDNGPEAIAYFKAGGIDLVITDLQMAGMDGLEVSQTLRKIEQQQHWPKCPIILQTANIQPDTRVNGSSAGITAFLPKPYKQQQLLQLVISQLHTANADD